MGLFNRKEKQEKMLMIHYEGIPSLRSNCPCNMILDVKEHRLIFEEYMTKNAKTISLPLDKISKAGLVNVTEIEKQSKLGRAAIGGLLFGGSGAIVGALSAGEKEKTKSLYIINYQSDGENKVIVLKENANLNFFKFQKHLQEMLPESNTITGITL